MPATSMKAVVLYLIAVSASPTSPVLDNSLSNYTDRALCFVLNKAIGSLAAKPLTIPTISGGGGCSLRWSAGPGQLSLKGVSAADCSWIDDKTGVGAAVSINGITVDGLPGYATDYDHKMWPINCIHLGDAHFTASVQANARVQLVLPKSLHDKCQSQVALPSFHDDISVTGGGFEAGLKQKILNALHATIQDKMRDAVAEGTTDKICDFITGCQDGILKCAQSADKTFHTCFNITHPNIAACEAQAKQTLTQDCSAVAKDCLKLGDETDLIV